MNSGNMNPINFVIVNLYPFEETISRNDVSFSDAVENIDIGGPAMLRSAAKNFERVTSICDPKDYPMIIEELKEKKKFQSLLGLDYLQRFFLILQDMMQLLQII